MGSNIEKGEGGGVIPIGRERQRQKQSDREMQRQIETYSQTDGHKGALI